MQELSNKTSGDTLEAQEWNQVPKEIENAIESIGLALSANDLDQLDKAIAFYSAAGSVYKDTGTANAKILSPFAQRKAIFKYEENIIITFRCVSPNTTAAVTINVNGLGVKNIKKKWGTNDNVSIGEVSGLVSVVYDGSNFILMDTSVAPLKINADGHLSLSTNGNFSVTAGGQLSLSSTITNSINEKAKVILSNSEAAAIAASAGNTTDLYVWED